MPNAVQINSPANVPYDADNPLPVTPTGAGGAELALETSIQTLIARVESLLASSQDIEVAAEDTGTINVAQDTAVVKNGAADLTPKFAAIAASSIGNNTIVAAVTAKKIRVLDYLLIGNGAVNAKFQSGAGGTDLTGLHYIASAGQGANAGGFSPVGKFETASGALLNLNLSGAVAVGGWLVYVEV